MAAIPSISREAAYRLPADSLAAGQQRITEIRRIQEAMTYEDFFYNYLLKNVPCILSASFTQTWRSRSEWVADDGMPNFTFLRNTFGHVTVPVADCSREEFCSHPKVEMTLADYLDYWEQLLANDHCPADDSKPCLYLKDWHFTRDFPNYQAYTTLPFFCSDWLNEFWDTRVDQPADDYKFVYMGPKGSWTPFHADVFRSYSWSANICGRKKWIFYPPEAAEHLQDRHGNLVYDVTSESLEDKARYPSAALAQPLCLEVIQQPGETIFVPSHWHHQVHNLEDTISINHNWFNGCNIHSCWGFLQSSLADVQREISDCRLMEGWPAQCQLILRASNGISYAEFYKLLETVACHRLAALCPRLPASSALLCSRQQEWQGSGEADTWHAVNPAEKGSASPTEKGPASPVEKGPASPVEKGPASPAEKGPASPAEKGPASPAEKGPASPAEKGPSSPTEKGPVSPAEKGPASPAEKGPESPVEKGPASSAEKGPASSAEKGPVSPAEKGPASPAEKGPASPAEKGLASPAEKGPASPAEKGPASPAEKGPVSPAEKGLASPAEKGPASPAEKGLASSAEKGPASPAEKGPVSPVEKGPVSPVEKGPVSPAEKGPASPAEKGPVSPVEKGPASPAEKGPASPAEKGPASPTEKGPASPAEKGPVSPVEKGPASPVSHEMVAGSPLSNSPCSVENAILGHILDFRHHCRDTSRAKSVHWGLCNEHHALFDLMQVRVTLEDMLSDGNFAHLCINPLNLIRAIQEAVEAFEKK